MHSEGTLNLHHKGVGLPVPVFAVKRAVIVGASLPIMTGALPGLFLGLVIIGDGEGFELLEVHVTGAVRFDEPRRDIGEF